MKKLATACVDYLAYFHPPQYSVQHIYDEGDIPYLGTLMGM